MLIKKVKPKRAVLTHLGLDADYEALLSTWVRWTEPGIRVDIHPQVDYHNIHYATFFISRIRLKRQIITFSTIN